MIITLSDGIKFDANMDNQTGKVTICCRGCGKPLSLTDIEQGIIGVTEHHENFFYCSIDCLEGDSK